MQAFGKLRSGSKDVKLTWADRYAALQNTKSVFEVYWPLCWTKGTTTEEEQDRHVKFIDAVLCLATRVMAATTTAELIEIDKERRSVPITGSPTKITIYSNRLLEHMIVQRNWEICRKAK
jgi:hypothetical protein